MAMAGMAAATGVAAATTGMTTAKVASTAAAPAGVPASVVLRPGCASTEVAGVVATAEEAESAALGVGEFVASIGVVGATGAPAVTVLGRAIGRRRTGVAHA